MFILLLEYFAASMKEKMAFTGHLLYARLSLTHFILMSLYIYDILSITQMMKLVFNDLPEVTQQRVD